MKYYLQVLKEFFRLKREEFSGWFRECLVIIIILCCIFLSTILYVCGAINNIFWMQLPLYICSGISWLLILILIGYGFSKLGKCIKKNWQQAKKNIKNK